MPEFPEVETIKRSLQKALVGKTIKNIEVRKAKIFQGNPQDIVGEVVEGVERKGKVLVIRLSRKKNLLIHFKLTGQMVWVSEAREKVTVGHPIPFAGSELPAKTTHIIYTINNGKLFYNDLRQFGWNRVVEGDEWRNFSEIKNLGPEPYDEEFTVEYLQKIFSKTSKPIKLILMDQEKIAGIGNIYANDALFEAGIIPTRSANKLSKEETENLREAIITVLEDGLKYGGSSAADEAYIKPTGEPGKYQEHFRVYQRDGRSCSRCGMAIKRIDLGGRGTFYCPNCQK